MARTKHEWEKLSLFTEPGGYDRMRCRLCHVEGRRYGVGQRGVSVKGRRSDYCAKGADKGGRRED